MTRRGKNTTTCGTSTVDMKMDTPRSQNLFKFTVGQRGGTLLVYDGFNFVRNRRGNLKTYWICAKKGSTMCNARLVTEVVDGVEKIVLESCSHNHEQVVARKKRSVNTPHTAAGYCQGEGDGDGDDDYKDGIDNNDEHYDRNEEQEQKKLKRQLDEKRNRTFVITASSAHMEDKQKRGQMGRRSVRCGGIGKRTLLVDDDSDGQLGSSLASIIFNKD